MGRPTKFKPEMVEQARKLAQLGATDREAAEFFGVSEDTVYQWKHVHADFSEALKVGKETADARVVQSLYRRALGYAHDATKIQVVDGEIVETAYVERYPPDTTAAIFWLKNRRPEEWRDVHRTEHTGADGGPVKVDDDTASAKIAALLAAAAQRANAD